MLLEHPNIYIPPYPEEVHFFNRSLLQPDLYFALFNVVEAKDKMLGEKSPNYFHMPEKCIRFVHSLMPEAQLLVLLRNPTERAWSQARMHTSSFNQRSLEKKDLFKLVLQVASRGNFERTNYAKVLRRWLQYFPKEQVLVYFYDDLQDNPQAFLDRICTDLGVAKFVPKGLEKRVHVSKQMTMPKDLRWFLDWRYKQVVKELEEMDYEVPNTWKENEVALSFLKRLIFLVVYLFWNLLTRVIYFLYQFKVKRSIVVPKIHFD